MGDGYTFAIPRFHSILDVEPGDAVQCRLNADSVALACEVAYKAESLTAFDVCNIRNGARSKFHPFHIQVAVVLRGRLMGRQVKVLQVPAPATDAPGNWCRFQMPSPERQAPANIIQARLAAWRQTIQRTCDTKLPQGEGQLPGGTGG